MLEMVKKLQDRWSRSKESPEDYAKKYMAQMDTRIKDNLKKAKNEDYGSFADIYTVEMKNLKKLQEQIITPPSGIIKKDNYKKKRIKALNQAVAKCKELFSDQIDNELNRASVFDAKMQSTAEKNHENAREREAFLSSLREQNPEEVLDKSLENVVGKQGYRGDLWVRKYVNDCFNTQINLHAKEPVAEQTESAITPEFIEDTIYPVITASIKEFSKEELVNGLKFDKLPEEQVKVKNLLANFDRLKNYMVNSDENGKIKKANESILEIAKDIGFDMEKDSHPLRKLCAGTNLWGKNGLEFLVDEHPKLLVTIMADFIFRKLDRVFLDQYIMNEQVTDTVRTQYVKILAVRQALSRTTAEIKTMEMQQLKDEFRIIGSDQNTLKYLQSIDSIETNYYGKDMDPDEINNLIESGRKNLKDQILGKDSEFHGDEINEAEIYDMSQNDVSVVTENVIGDESISIDGIKAYNLSLDESEENEFGERKITDRENKKILQNLVKKYENDYIEYVRIRKSDEYQKREEQLKKQQEEKEKRLLQEEEERKERQLKQQEKEEAERLLQKQKEQQEQKLKKQKEEAERLLKEQQIKEQQLLNEQRKQQEQQLLNEQKKQQLNKQKENDQERKALSSLQSFVEKLYEKSSHEDYNVRNEYEFKHGYVDNFFISFHKQVEAIFKFSSSAKNEDKVEAMRYLFRTKVDVENDGDSFISSRNFDGLKDFQHLIFSGIPSWAEIKEMKDYKTGLSFMINKYPQLLGNICLLLLSREIDDSQNLVPEDDVEQNKLNKLNVYNDKIKEYIQQLDKNALKEGSESASKEYQAILQSATKNRPELFANHVLWQNDFEILDSLTVGYLDLYEKDFKELNSNNKDELKELLENHSEDSLLKSYVNYRIEKIDEIEKIAVESGKKANSSKKSGKINLKDFKHQPVDHPADGWSSALADMLHFQKIELSPQTIRAYRVTMSDKLDGNELIEESLKQNLELPSNIDQHMNLISKVLPNAVLHKANFTCETEEDYKRLKEYLKDKVENATTKQAAPLVYCCNNQYKVITGIKDDTIRCYNSTDANSLEYSLKDLKGLTSQNRNMKKPQLISLYWLGDMTPEYLKELSETDGTLLDDHIYAHENYDAFELTGSDGNSENAFGQEYIYLSRKELEKDDQQNNIVEDSGYANLSNQNTIEYWESKENNVRYWSAEKFEREWVPYKDRIAAQNMACLEIMKKKASEANKVFMDEIIRGYKLYCACEKPDQQKVIRQVLCKSLEDAELGGLLGFLDLYNEIGFLSQKDTKDPYFNKWNRSSVRDRGLFVIEEMKTIIARKDKDIAIISQWKPSNNKSDQYYSISLEYDLKKLQSDTTIDPFTAQNNLKRLSIASKQREMDSYIKNAEFTVNKAEDGNTDKVRIDDYFGQ